MWFLLQGTIITAVAGWLHDKTPNPVARGVVGFAAAWLATWLNLEGDLSAPAPDPTMKWK